jgi:hypothetical protein
MSLKEIKKPHIGASAVERNNKGKFVAGKRPKEKKATSLKLFQDIGIAIDQTGKKRSLFLQEAAEFYLRHLYGEDVEIMGLLQSDRPKPAIMP